MIIYWFQLDYSSRELYGTVVKTSRLVARNLLFCKLRGRANMAASAEGRDERASPVGRDDDSNEQEVNPWSVRGGEKGIDYAKLIGK